MFCISLFTWLSPSTIGVKSNELLLCLSSLAIDFLLLLPRVTLYSFPPDMKLNLTVIGTFSISLFVLTRSSILSPVYFLYNAKLMASKIVDFPAPFSPIIKLMPELKSIEVFLCDLKFSSSSLVNIIISPL